MDDGSYGVVCQTHWQPGRIRTTGTAIIFSIVQVACAVGPDYHTPSPPPGDRVTAEPLPSHTVGVPGPAGATQWFVTQLDIPGQWWALYHCEPLNALINEALSNSPTLIAAQAALRQARENLSAEVGGALFPSIDAQLGAGRQKVSGLTIGEPGVSQEFTLYNASVNVAYAFDLFGGARRELEALGAQIDYQRYQWQAAYLALTANLVTASIRQASLRAQIETTRQIVADQRAQLNLLERQFNLGAIDRSAVLAQRTQLAQTRATLPPLQQALIQTRHQIAVLAGKSPADDSLPEFKLSDFSLPQDLPVSLPSALVRQRPDILAADALMHQASAQVGVATAAMYPQLTLSASYGSMALTPAGAFNAANTIWNIAGGLLQPIFHGGQLSAKKRAAAALYDQAAAQYKQTVLQAFQNVADALWALDNDARSLAAQTEAASAARAALTLIQHQYRLGAVSYLALLDAQRQYQQTVVSLAQAQAARYADTAALFQAVGGGWWNASEPDDVKSVPTPMRKTQARIPPESRP